MKKGSIILLVVLGLLLIGGCMTCNVQKSLVTLDENAKSKWGEVQNQYQRRADLVPNLVNTVKGAANFEKSTLEAVTQARANATSLKVDADDLSPEKIHEFQQRQGELSQALGRLLKVPRTGSRWQERTLMTLFNNTIHSYEYFLIIFSQA